MNDYNELLKCLTEVSKKLNAAGLKCSVEYPGYLCIPQEGDSSWNIGVENDTWGGELVVRDQPVTVIQFNQLPADFRDVTQIVSILLMTFSKQLEQHEVIQSFQNQIRILKSQCAYRDGQISELRKALKL